jgi:hypothetical protein
MTTLRTEQEVMKLKQEVRKICKEVSLHWNTATADRNIANSLKGFAREVFKFAKVMRKIAIKLETRKRNASRSLPANQINSTYHSNIFISTKSQLMIQSISFSGFIYNSFPFHSK